MENLHIEETKYTPEINLNAEKGLLSFSGKSYPENTFDFYQPVIEWINTYFAEKGQKKTLIDMDIIYFNSSSSKLFFDFFDILEEAHEDGKEVTVRWLYDAENENALEAGEDFKEDFESLSFDLIEK